MYTKGEWMADNGDSEYWGVFTDIDDDGICYMCEPNGKLLRTFDEAEANAHLISAAPDLYEACKLALNFIGRDKQTRVILEKALAKANQSSNSQA